MIRDGSLVPLKKQKLQFSFYEKNDEKYTKFKSFHMKPMHLVVVKSDLSYFSHIHPYLNENSFEININDTYPEDFDNQFTARVIPEHGTYFLFSEINTEDFGALEFRFEEKTSEMGRELPLEEDLKNENGDYFRELDENKRVVFQVQQIPGCGGVLVDFVFHFLERNMNQGRYEDLSGLEPWMMMGGHSIVLSEAGRTAQAKTFLHLHADLPSQNSQYRFSTFNRGSLSKGIYRIWSQVKVRGRILTVPMTFKFNPVAPLECS